MTNNMAGNMQSLCDDIMASHNARKIALAFVKDESKTIRGDARILIGQLQIIKRRKANALHKELKEFRRALVPRTHTLLKACRSRRVQNQAELRRAGESWRTMAAELKERRRSR